MSSNARKRKAPSHSRQPKIIVYDPSQTGNSNLGGHDMAIVTQWDIRRNNRSHASTRRMSLTTSILPHTQPQGSAYNDVDMHLLEEPSIWQDYTSSPMALQDAWGNSRDEPDRENDSNINIPPLQQWIAHRQTFLEELLRLESRGDAMGNDSCCVECKLGPADYRCRDCFSGGLHCRKCIIDRHVQNPFHLLEHWEDGYFHRISLKDLGHRVQLGHQQGHTCLVPRAAKDPFVVIEINGVHEVALDFCNCETAQPLTIQLLRAKLFPGSLETPMTAATFRALDFFHKLSFESKISAFEYYHTLARLTVNDGTRDVKKRYDTFLRMAREWRHLKLLKRSGLRHDSRGGMDLSPGSCAIQCPACPQPGRNLAPDWHASSPEKQWLYTLFVSLDANFRLRRKNVSNELRDPSLNQGAAYFVDEIAYKEHIAKYSGEKQDRSTCVSHDAVNNADKKDTRGLAVTGVGTVDCSRHDFKRPCAVGDLQVGERYLNMDFLFFSTLSETTLQRIVVSYDIACQWSKKFWDRMARFPSTWAINNGYTDLIFLVPKFHLPAHIPQCHREFSFNLTPYVGRTDGEAPERGWANLNPLASSTKEMGPGSRQDTLDDHIGDSNWKKVIAFGDSLLHKFRIAINEEMVHSEALHDLESVIDEQMILKWRVEVEAWEHDSTKSNPFESRVDVPTLKDVRLALAKRESQLQSTAAVVMQATLSGSEMLILGLELEELQRRLQHDISVLGPHATTLQKARHQERMNALSRRISTWSEVQALYIPAATILRKQEADLAPKTPEIPVYKMELWLPSAIVNQAPCSKVLQEDEWLLREAQAHDSLQELRQCLRLRSFLVKQKRDWSRGVAENTRSKTVIGHTSARIKICTARYRAARSALCNLAYVLEKPVLGWTTIFKELRDEDVRGLPVMGLGEGHQTLSWIWLAEGVLNEDTGTAGLTDALRIQWCRARARAHRWSEEIELLDEEMRRVVEYLTWEVKHWRERGERAGEEESGLKEGLLAYACRQAGQRASLKARFLTLWEPRHKTLEERRANQGTSMKRMVQAESQ